MAGNLSPGGDGLLLSWIEPGLAAKTFRLRFSRWRAGSWSPPLTVVSGTALVVNWADVPSVREAADGALIAHWAERRDEESHATVVMLGRSTDGGKTWKPLGQAHDDDTQTEHGFVSLLPEGPAVRAFWLDGRQQQGGLRHRGAMSLRTAEVSERVAASEVLDTSVCDCCGTAAAMTAKGPIIVFRDRHVGEIRDVSIIRREGGGWTAPKAVSEDGWKIPGCPVNGPAVAAEGSRVAVAWFTYAGGRAAVKVAFSTDAGATFSVPVEVDGPRGRAAPIGRVAVVLDKDAALVSWMVSDRERAEILVRRVVSGGRRSAPLVLAQSQSDRESGFPRLSRSDRQLFLAWTQAGAPSRLRFQAWPLSAVPAATELPEEPAPPAALPLAVGTVMPAYSARTLEGKVVDVTSLRGHPVLLNFWATWCEPCRMELPELVKLHRRLAPRGLVVVGVSLDSGRTPEQVKAFAARRDVGYALLVDSDDLASRILGISTLPVTVLIDAKGAIAWSQTGAIVPDDPGLAAALERSLR